MFGSPEYEADLALREDALLEAMADDAGESVEMFSGAASGAELVEASEVAIEVTEATVAGTMGSIAAGLVGLAIMIGGTIGFKKLYKKLNEAHWHGEDYSGRTGYYEPEGNDRTHGPGGPVLYVLHPRPRGQQHERLCHLERSHGILALVQSHL